MIVEMRARISGTRNGQDWPLVGETIELPDDEAQTLIDRGQAQAAPTKAEAATAPKPEKAAAAKPRTAKAAKAETR